MTADAHPAPTTAVLRPRMGDLVSRCAATGTRRSAGAPRRGPLIPRRRRLVADPPVPAPDLWAIDRDELRSALDDGRF